MRAGGGHAIWRNGATPHLPGTRTIALWFWHSSVPQSTLEQERSMNEMFAQGDLLIERVADVEPSGTLLAPDATGAMVLAEGEFTGHRHATFDRVTMFRDDTLAREIPAGLYIGHIKVEGGSALIQHQEHAPLSLSEGTYRVRRQRELEPKDAVLVSD
jgi:hypothetical protein